MRWWNDGAVMAHAGFPLGLGTTVEKEAARLPSPGRLMLEYKNQPIGEMNFRDVGEKTAEIGIKIPLFLISYSVLCKDRLSCPFNSRNGTDYAVPILT